MQEKYARVRVLDVPYHSDRVYEYTVPAAQADEVTAGCFVTVAFGFGDRKCKAIVTDVSDQPESARELKPIDAVMPGAPVLAESELSLCRFLCDYTLCSFGEAVKCVVPSAAFSKLDYYYTAVSDLSHTKQKKLSDEELSAYSFIRREGRVSSSRLKAELGARAVEALGHLVRCGAIKKEAEVKQPTNIKYTTFVSLAVDEADARDAMSKKNSPVQAEILRILCEGDTDAETLSRLIGKSVTPQLSTLEKKGLVKVEREVAYRNPYRTAQDEHNVYENSALSDEQSEAVEKLNELLGENAPRAALLHGVTGSGKTRVIKEMIDKTLSAGRGVIILVPEISLTPQTVGIFCSCYGERTAVLHSALSQGERFDAWRRIRQGEADVVIGTRSAVFAPVKNLGMIVIDEEQEHTYKSDTDPKYLAHDVARYRCGKNNALMLLSSATPSVTSYYKAVSGAYTLVELKSRFGAAKLPEVIISDMRDDRYEGNTSPVGSALLEKMAETKNEGNQSIVFLNRRGYNSAVSCRVCGEAIKCPNCSVSLTYHAKRAIGAADGAEDYFRRRAERGSLSCHYCGYKTKVPTSCPSCSAEHFRFVGCGTQQAEEEIGRLLPGIRVSRMDMDTTGTKQSFEKILNGFREGKSDVLLGTQMVTKGHDFPNVTTVGVMNADASLFLDDYTAGEKTFSMLTQVIGRAGRGEKAGCAVIQTCNPNSEVIKLAAEQDYRGFFDKEITVRRALTFPPFCDIAVLYLVSTDESVVKSGADRLSEFVQTTLKGDFEDVELIAFGPFEAPVYKVQNSFRMRMIFKCRLNRRTRMLFSHVLREFGAKTTKGLTLTADFNPSGL